MFTNLIESSSHAREFKRRGSFVLITTTTYALLFVFGGVISIYAYDARLEEPASEITVLSPVDLEPTKAEPLKPVKAPPSGDLRGGGGAFVRKNPTAGVDRPDLPPPSVSASPNLNPPLPAGAKVTIDNYNSNPGSVGPGISGGGGNGRNSSGEGTLHLDVETPPPAPIQKPIPSVIQKKIINGEALFLPKPPYPPIAKQLHIQGTVNVQVLVDEMGRVVSAKAVLGNPALMHAAQQAAMNARFSPTRIGDQSVKVSGMITYNFVLQ